MSNQVKPDTAAPRRKRVRLGELLLEAGLISQEQLTQALAQQKKTGRKLGRVLVDLNLLPEDALQDCLSRHLQIPFVDVRSATLDSATVRLLPEAQARRFRALVLQSDGKSLLLGMADPTDLFAYDELSKRLQQPLRLALVNEVALLKTLDLVYRRTDEIASLAQEVREELKAGDIDIDHLSAEAGSPDAPVLRLLQSMFQDAVQSRASDLHIEPAENALRIRQRVDGVLQEQVIDGRRVAGALVTRLKLMCGLDIAEKRLPQDGRFSVKVKDRSLDVRLATMPVQYGEAVVMRLLDHDAQLLTFERIGMPAALLERFKALVGRSAGMVLVTGPTGSGKTTTLYSALNHLNQSDTKIITVEDPVEYRLDRINQVQVNTKIGLDFGRVLRTVLRQDPDVILVGEMRDRETVEIGLRAAITGHVVFSTLHTMNAVATVERLLDMGAPGYMIATAVHAILAQRLLRRVCEDCGEDSAPTPNQLAWLVAQVGAQRAAQMRFRTGAGCTYCNLTGYRGRTAVYELLEMDRTLAELARRGALEEFSRAAHASAGYVPLVLGAIDLAASGVTSLAEAISVTSGVDESDGLAAAKAEAGAGCAAGAGADADADAGGDELDDRDAERLIAG